LPWSSIGLNKFILVLAWPFKTFEVIEIHFFVYLPKPYSFVYCPFCKN